MTADLCQDIISRYSFLHLVLALMENFLEGIVPLRYIGALPQMSRVTNTNILIWGKLPKPQWSEWLGS